VGEVGLLGELRPVSGLDRRLREASRLGFQRAIAPMGKAGASVRVEGIDVVPVANLRDAIAAALEGGGSGPSPSSAIAIEPDSQVRR
jgi:DNA repair protein RadA/Sms